MAEALARTPEVEEVEGDAFGFLEGGGRVVLMHCVSADLAMGKGFARLVRDAFGQPTAVTSWREAGPHAILQPIGPWGRCADLAVLHLVTKCRYCDKPTTKTLHKALWVGVNLLREWATAERPLTRVVGPRLGCGLDRLQWEHVRPMLTPLPVLLQCPVLIASLPSPHPPPPRRALTSPPGVYTFWKLPSRLSNFAPTPYELEGVRFRSSEHGLMYEKAQMFAPGTDFPARILAAPKGKDAKRLGRSVPGFRDAEWMERIWEVFLPHLRAKFTQNAQALEELLATEGRLVAEASPLDARWGTGLDAERTARTPPSEWPGQNLLGRMLMVVRRELCRTCD